MNLHRALPALVVGLVAMVALVGCGNGNSYGSTTKQTGTPASGAVASPSASAGASAGGVAAVASATVTIQNLTFVPQTLTVKAGAKVTWTNNDTTVHDVTSTDGPAIDAATTGTFASGTLNQGDSFSFTFTKAGTYYYECTIHASMSTMHAKVVVQ